MGQGSGPAHRLTKAERLELQHRVRAGESHRAAAISVGCSAKSVQRLLWKTGGVNGWHCDAKGDCNLKESRVCHNLQSVSLEYAASSTRFSSFPTWTPIERNYGALG
jgi:hypothetical protein